MHLKDYVEVEGQEYYISTTRTFDVGLETMVFKSNKRRVSDWGQVYFNHYKNEEEAIKGHQYVLNNLDDCIKESGKRCWEEETGLSETDILVNILGGLFNE